MCGPVSVVGVIIGLWLVSLGWSPWDSASSYAPTGSTRSIRCSGSERGDGRRTRVWVEGLPDPIIASRTEGTILRDMGQGAAADAPLLDEAIDLASRLATAAEAGRVDLSDLGRRARHLLAATTERG